MVVRKIFCSFFLSGGRHLLIGKEVTPHQLLTTIVTQFCGHTEFLRALGHGKGRVQNLRGNIATASSLHPPPPPSRSLQTVHCRLLHAASARTSPPPLSPHPPPHQRTKASILTKKATAFATAMVPLLARGTLLGSPQPQRRRQRRRRHRRSPQSRRREEAREAIFVKGIDLPRAGHCCLPGGRESHAATICVHLPPHCPTPPSRLAAATPTMCRGEGSPLAMKRSIRTASASSGGGVRRHLLLYNSADRPTHQFCSLRD